MANEKPVRISITLPAALIPLMRKRQKEERYHSLSDYIAGLGTFCAYCRREHKLTGPLFREPQWVIDKVMDQLVKDFDTLPPEERPGGWFEERIEELVTKAKGEGKPKVKTSKKITDLVKRATKKPGEEPAS